MDLPLEFEGELEALQQEVAAGSADDLTRWSAAADRHARLFGRGYLDEYQLGLVARLRDLIRAEVKAR
jgi:hypothetical protein